MDSLAEEVVEEQVLELGVLAVAGKISMLYWQLQAHWGLRLGDLLQEDGSDNAATTPHEGDFGLVQLPLVLLGGLCPS